MTSHELARQLLAGPDRPVHHAYNYGDYWRTQVAPEVDMVTDGVVKHSEYHRMPKVVAEDVDEIDEGDVEVPAGAARVILLS